MESFENKCILPWDPLGVFLFAEKLVKSGLKRNFLSLGPGQPLAGWAIVQSILWSLLQSVAVHCDQLDAWDKYGQVVYV